MIKNCQNCNKEFQAKISELKRGRAKFCSHKCAAKIKFAKFLGIRKGAILSDETKKKISLAKMGKKASKEQAERLKNLRLGKRNSKEQNRKIGEKLRGSNNGSWQGGITPLSTKIRNCLKYRQWRSDCFTRDDYTCQICWVRGSYLEVDHYPKMFSVILKEYGIKTFEEAMLCEELWNLNNGRVLCRKCHDKTKRYGKKNERIGLRI